MSKKIPSAGLNGGRNRNGRHNIGGKNRPTEAQFQASNRKRQKKGNPTIPIPQNLTPPRTKKPIY